jgi:hypothetical protein
MEKPGRFGGRLTRDYLAWLKKRLTAGDQGVLRPKRIPLDVRAYWALNDSEKTTKGAA